VASVSNNSPSKFEELYTIISGFDHHVRTDFGKSRAVRHSPHR
jgi:hypothetical protein